MFKNTLVHAVMLLTCSLFLHGQSSIDRAILDERRDAIVGENVEVRSKFYENAIVEPTIAAHPVNNDILLAAAMVVTDHNLPYESFRLSSFYTRDGGVTWTETAHDYYGYDPWVALLSGGQATMTWLGTPEKFQHQFPLQVFTSSNSGKTWDTKVQRFNGTGHGHDGTKVAGHNREFYLTTLRFNPSMQTEVVLYESKSGSAFREVGAIPDKGSRLNFCEPAILTDGTVVVPTTDHRDKIWVSLFHPDSHSWSGPFTVSNHPKGGRGYMRMAADMGVRSPFKDRIYLTRAVADGQNSQGVLLNYSSDQGKTWSKDRRVDLFTNGMVSKANVASVAVNSDGVIGISWVDGQEHPDQKMYDLYFTLSKDGGQSFQSPCRVTDISSDPRTTANGDVANKFVGGGHYLGMTPRADASFQLIWSDSRHGIFKLQTCNVDVK